MNGRSNSNRLKRAHRIPTGATVHRRKPLPKKRDTQPDLELAWRQNWPLLIGLSSVGFISARLLGVATGDPETAYAILQAAGTGSVVVGGLIPAIGLLLFPISVAVYHYGFSRATSTRHSEAPLMIAIGSTALVITIFTAPAGPLLGTIIFSVFVIAAASWLRYIARPKVGQRKRGRFSIVWPPPHILIALFSAIAIASTIVSSNPWLPSQNIIMKGRHGFSAFILAQTDQTTTILTQRPTAVVQLPSSEIITTEICKTLNYRSQEETINQWLGNFLSGRPIHSYPRCDPSFYSVKSR
jgi:hypothetical protein